MNNSREMMSVLRADLNGFVLTEVEAGLYDLAGIFGGEVFDLSPSCYVSGVEFPLYLSPERTAPRVGNIKFVGEKVIFVGNEMVKCQAMLARDGEFLQVKVVTEEDFLSFPCVIEIAKANHQLDDFGATHFAEWLFLQEELQVARDNGRIKLFCESEVAHWMDRYEAREIRVLNKLSIDYFADNMNETRIESLHQESFRELADRYNLALRPVPDDFKFVKGGSYVITGNAGWKFIRVC